MTEDYIEERFDNIDKRINGLESEVKDMKELTLAISEVDKKVDILNTEVSFTFKEIKNNTIDMKKDISEIKERPAKNHDKLLWLVIGALVSGVVGYVLTLVLA